MCRWLVAGLLLAVVHQAVEGPVVVAQNAVEPVTVWIGMGTPPPGQTSGIYRATFHPDTGQLERPELAAEIGGPEFLTVRPDGRRLYAAIRQSDGSGAVAAFEITPAADNSGTAKLRLMNTQPVGGGTACYVALDPSARALYTAQYGDGTVAAFPLANDGSLLPRSALVKHTGSGPNPDRQREPHPHSANPYGNFVFVPDLGTDAVVIYRTDPAVASLEPHGQGTCPPGSGPRHMTFSPDGKFAYVVNELGVTVTAFQFDRDAGTLTPLQTVPTLPAELRDPTTNCSEIRMHPSGRFLFAGNRGHDSVTAFAVDPATGQLTFIEQESVRGNHPRNFNLDPTGHWLLAAGRDSQTIAVFRIDPTTGELGFTGQTLYSPAPICIVFQPPADAR